MATPPPKKHTSFDLISPVEPELAPPAEWLLLNANSGGTADPELLAEALTVEHYPFLLKLAAVVCGDLQTGRLAALETLALAVQQAYRYPPRVSVRAWLAGLLLAACPADGPPVRPLVSAADAADLAWQGFRSLPQPERLALALELLLEWPLAEIESVPGLEAPAAGQSLSTPERLILAHSLQRHAPASDPSEDELERLAADAARRAAHSADRRRRRAAVREMVLIGITILGVVLVIFTANRLLPDEPAPGSPGFPVFATPSPTRGWGSSLHSAPSPTPMWEQHVAYVVKPGDSLDIVARRAGMSVEALQRINGLTRAEALYAGQPLWVLVPGYSSGLPADLPVEPAQPDFTVEVSPLTPASRPQEIRERVRQSRKQWHSLWIDFQMAYYGPLSYTAEARAYRSQVWVDRQNRSLEIYNDLSNMPEMRHITLGGRSYTSAVRYSGSYLDGDWAHASDVLLANPLLRDLVFPGESSLTSELSYITPLRLDTIAGHQALVGDWTFPAGSWSFRLWIDTRLGIILRRQLIEAATGVLISDMIATAIAVDIDLPEALFNPLLEWRDGFAFNYDGERFPYEYLPPTPTWALPAQRPTLTP